MRGRGGERKGGNGKGREKGKGRGKGGEEGVTFSSLKNP